MPSSRCVLGRCPRSSLPAFVHRGPGREASDGGDVSQDCVCRSGQNVYTALGRSIVPGSAGISDHHRHEAAVGTVPASNQASHPRSCRCGAQPVGGPDTMRLVVRTGPPRPPDGRSSGFPTNGDSSSSYAPRKRHPRPDERRLPRAVSRLRRAAITELIDRLRRAGTVEVTDADPMLNPAFARPDRRPR
jgi:hypothetical protein